MIADIVGGMAKACKESGCALIGGETAEMPGVYMEGEFDIAGTIVGAVDEEKILNPEGLRMPNEFVFHKILDAIGDLFVAGYRIIGNYKSIKGGHTHNNGLVKLLMLDESNYQIIEL